MDEKDWLILKTLHEKRNITKTAAVVYISQPALSKRLKLIEDRFGVSVALRNKSGIELTPAGEYLALCSYEILSKMRDIDEHISNMGQEVKGTLRIGSSFFCTKFALPDVLMRFKEKYPLVEFKLATGWSSDVIKMVQNGEVHVGFIRNESQVPTEKYLLFREKAYICSKKELDMAKLPDEPLIRHGSDVMVIAEFEAWWDENYTRPPLVAMVVDKVDSSAEMVARGLGYAFLSEFSANRLPGIYKYEIRYKNGEPLYRNTWVTVNQGAKPLKIVRCFVDFVANFAFKGEFGSLQPFNIDAESTVKHA